MVLTFNIVTVVPAKAINNFYDDSSEIPLEYSYEQINEEPKSEESKNQESKSEEPKSESGIEVDAKSALLMEPVTGKIIYEKNIDEKFAPASVTKIMTMLLTMEAIDSGKISLEDKVTCSENAKKWGRHHALRYRRNKNCRGAIKGCCHSIR